MRRVEKCREAGELKFMEPIKETYRGHQIEINDEAFAIAGLEIGTLNPKLGIKPVIRVDGDDVTRECASADQAQSPEAILASAREYVEKKFIAR